tara:strand:- start:156 stop:638 length:483 start_codon:yes stop_codon:yes gene_type:complete
MAITTINTLKYPSFFAHLGATVNVNDNVWTKVQFNTEAFDTNSLYDNSTNYRFSVPTGLSGKWLVTANMYFYDGDNQLTGGRAAFYKSGSQITEYNLDMQGGGDRYFAASTPTISACFNLSDSDYIEVYARGNTLDSGTFTIQGSASIYNAFFQAVKLIT